MMFADASNEFTGQWVSVAFTVVSCLGGIAAIASYFATRRELNAVERRVTKVEEDVQDHYQQNQIHASERSRTIFAEIKDTREKLSNRIDPLVENTAALKAGMEAQTNALSDFTDVMRALVERQP